MLWRCLLIGLVSFALGVLAFAGYTRFAPPSGSGFLSTNGSTAVHWHAVKAYRDAVLHPKKIAKDPQSGMGVLTNVPRDPEQHLAALVAADEIREIDLVLPTVPNSREANRLWMKWAEGNDDVFHATGNTEYTDFPTKGAAPLHLHVWFRDEATASVQQLIRDLEALSDMKR